MLVGSNQKIKNDFILNFTQNSSSIEHVSSHHTFSTPLKSLYTVMYISVASYLK